VAQIDIEDNNKGIIIISNDDKHRTSNVEDSITPKAKSYSLKVEEYNLLLE
jgi:hypothetical protein